MGRHPLRITPFHVAGTVFLFVGLLLAAYHGLEKFGVVTRLTWTSWSHIHFVTIGGITQLLFGMLPQLTAHKLGRPIPSRWSTLGAFGALNGGFLLVWYGRGWGHPWAFDLGLAVLWVLVAALLGMLVWMVRHRDRAVDTTIGLYLVALFVFLWGITYAYGLYAHVWDVPGGWLGLREAHVHANAWGFLGLAAIGTLTDLFPRILGTQLYSQRLRTYTGWLLVAGIFPLITGPWLGMGRSITATGLLLYGAGFVLYLYNLLRTYQAAPSHNGIGTSVLAAQFWLLGPAVFAPFVLFGIEWVPPAYIEDGALHFFFMGWALPVALAGLVLFARNLRGPRAQRPVSDGPDRSSNLPPVDVVPAAIPTALVWAWNLAVLIGGIAFIGQGQPWAEMLFGVGFTVLGVLWLYLLVQVIRVRRTFRRGSRSVP